MILFFFGVRGILFERPLEQPSWYDFLWFGLGTFLMLNPDASAPSSTEAQIPR
jgi:hypothetical protein